MAFIAEYVTVMKFFDTAQDILHYKMKVMANLVPTITVLKEIMLFLVQNSLVQCCKPHVISVNASIDSS